MEDTKQSPPFKQGHWYKNKYNTDVCFEVFGVLPLYTIYVVTGNWINIVSRPYVMQPDVIKIKKKDVGNWEDYNVREIQ